MDKFVVIKSLFQQVSKVENKNDIFKKLADNDCSGSEEAIRALKRMRNYYIRRTIVLKRGDFSEKITKNLRFSIQKILRFHQVSEVKNKNQIFTKLAYNDCKDSVEAISALKRMRNYYIRRRIVS